MSYLTNLKQKVTYFVNLFSFVFDVRYFSFDEHNYF
jgi:hypothetical protein